MFTHTETDRYRLSFDAMGFVELFRKADGASAYFQGDDAALWWRNLDAMEKTHADDEPALIRSFDFLCEGYDEVLAASPTAHD